MDMDGVSEDASRRIQVRFITKLKAPLKVSKNAIAIPSNLTRLGLSTIVNNLLLAGMFLIFAEISPGYLPFYLNFVSSLHINFFC